MRRPVLLLPLALVAAAFVAFFFMLRGMQAGTFNPRGVPSMLMDKPVPAFALPGAAAHPGFAAAELHRAGRPVLVNFFASWCEPCVAEAPVLAQVKQAGLQVWGIAYKDKPLDLARFLGRRGDPYQRIADDAAGRLAIDWGVTGVPESYLIDSAGIVRWRFVGPLTPDVVEHELLPKAAALS